MAVAEPNCSGDCSVSSSLVRFTEKGLAPFPAGVAPPNENGVDEFVGVPDAVQGENWLGVEAAREKENVVVDSLAGD